MSIDTKALRGISSRFQQTSIDVRNEILTNIYHNISQYSKEMLNINHNEINSKFSDQTSTLFKRSCLTPLKINEVLKGVLTIIEMDDPINQILDPRFSKVIQNGLKLYRTSTPLGIICVIFEARPEVLIQLSALSIKTGNVLILKGGSEVNDTLQALYTKCILPAISIDDIIQIVYSREEMIRIISSPDPQIDLVIPRGSADLVKFISSVSKVPVMGHADGVCHTYIHSGIINYSPDWKQFVKDIVINAKCQYPAVCNATETLLIDAKFVETEQSFINDLFNDIIKAGVTDVFVLDDSPLVFNSTNECIVHRVSPENKRDQFTTEFCDYKLNICIVNDINEAISHINTYGSHHTDCIITGDSTAAALFGRSVDSACVFTNCSTRFADGYRFGFGAEVGVSTHRLHARGPVGIDGLLSYKYQLIGDPSSTHIVTGENDFLFTRLPDSDVNDIHVVMKFLFAILSGIVLSETPFYQDDEAVWHTTDLVNYLEHDHVPHEYDPNPPEFVHLDSHVAENFVGDEKANFLKFLNEGNAGAHQASIKTH